MLHQPCQQHTKRDSKKKPEVANLSVCRNKIGYGHYAAAIRVLSSDGIAPRNDNTLAELESKHPASPPPSILNTYFCSDPVTVDSRVVLGAIKSFPKGTSCGRDGLRAQHLVDALSGAAARVTYELVFSITGVVNLWLAGKCPNSLGEYIASAPFTPLLKPGYLGLLRLEPFGVVWFPR